MPLRHKFRSSFYIHIERLCWFYFCKVNIRIARISNRSGLPYPFPHIAIRNTFPASAISSWFAWGSLTTSMIGCTSLFLSRTSVSLYWRKLTLCHNHSSCAGTIYMVWWGFVSSKIRIIVGWRYLPLSWLKKTVFISGLHRPIKITKRLISSSTTITYVLSFCNGRLYTKSLRFPSYNHQEKN